MQRGGKQGPHLQEHDGGHCSYKKSATVSQVREKHANIGFIVDHGIKQRRTDGPAENGILNKMNAQRYTRNTDQENPQSGERDNGKGMQALLLYKEKSEIPPDNDGILSMT